MHGTEGILITSVLATALGVSAQIIAHRFRLPAILPLLIFGMAAGPSGLGLFDPSVFGHGLEVIVHLGVAIILFEGGLSLDLRQLRIVGDSLRNLLTIGMLVTWGGAAALAHYLMGISWSTAALFGAIVTVTGPTVIAPLLRHMVAPKRVRTLLLSEGLMIDPIGAVLAYLVLQWIERAGMGLRQISAELITLSATGAVLGFVAGFLAVMAVRRRTLSEELRNLVILALLLGTFAVAEMQAPQSGILASVVMGLTVSAAGVPDLGPVKAFKGQLTVLTISILFVLLSGQLDLAAMGGLGWQAAWVMLGVILLVRPLSVWVSVLLSKNRLDWKAMTMLGLTAPRGIVAAAVASLSAIELRSSGATADATVLEGLVYLTIIVTCTWATLMAGVLPRALGYLNDPSRRRVVLVGVNGLTSALSLLMRREGWMPVVVDSVPLKLAPFRDQQISTTSGDARDAATYDAAGVERDSRVLALTTNDELNLLVAELVRNEFGVEHPVVALQTQPQEFGSSSRAWVDLLGNRDLHVPRWSRWLDEGRAEIITVDRRIDNDAAERLLAMRSERPEDMLVLCGWRDGRPTFDWAEADLALLPRLSLLIRSTVRQEIEELRGEEIDSEALSITRPFDAAAPQLAT
ncbi:MAG: cation:proton antiporter [Acidobacteriota bacterium]